MDSSKGNVDSSDSASNQRDASSDDSEAAVKEGLNDTQRALHSLKILADDQGKFMENFNPETSSRKMRKIQQKNSNGGRKQNNLYDEKGLLVSSGKDLCDCLNDYCVGCHFPCPKCRSPKCGPECRVNRKFVYDQVEIEGTDIVIRGKYRK